MLNLCLCDDDTSFADTLHHLLKKSFTDIDVVRICGSVQAMLAAAADGMTADIFLLDIRFRDEGQDGIGLARQLRARFPNAQIIFISNYPDYISDVYEVEHCYFVLKNQLELYLPAAINRARQNLNVEKKQLMLNTGHGKKSAVPLSEILYFERKKRTTEVVLATGVLYTSTALPKLLCTEEGGGFVRCHNSFIVNLRHVRTLLRTELVLEGGNIVPVSRYYRNAVQQQFAQFMCSQL